MQIPSWDQVANGVWRTTIGSTPSLDLLSQSGVARWRDHLADAARAARAVFRCTSILGCAITM